MKQQYQVNGMDCADCALKVEKGVRRLPGIETVVVNFATGTLTLQGQVSESVLRQRLEALGYGLAQSSKDATGKTNRVSGDTGFLTGFWHYLRADNEVRLALIGGVLLVAGVAAGIGAGPSNSSSGAASAGLLAAGYPTARKGLANLWINRDFNISLLMTLAAVGAVIIGEITEAASLVFLFTLAEALEGYTAVRARRTLSELRQLTPEQAIRLSAAGEESVPVSMLAEGDRILVRPGERIAMDGLVFRGQSEVNQAPITGESLPVEKASGSEVFAGTVNGSGVLEVTITHTAGNSMLDRILHLVEKSQARRARIQRFIDRFAQIYTPVMVGLAVLVAALPPLLWGQPFWNTADGAHGWLYRALALLVIACPCALVISTPVTVISALAQAARRGVLIKGGAFLEALAHIRIFAFDKTGTLTRGAPVVVRSLAVDCAGDELCPACDDVLALASALERRSAHPLAQAIVTAAAARGVDEYYPPAEEVQALAGRGVQGLVNGKRAAYWQSPALRDRTAARCRSMPVGGSRRE